MNSLGCTCLATFRRDFYLGSLHSRTYNLDSYSLASISFMQGVSQSSFHAAHNTVSHTIRCRTRIHTYQNATQYSVLTSTDEGGKKRKRKKVLTWRKKRKKRVLDLILRSKQAQAGILNRVMVALLSDWLLMSVIIQTPSYLYTPVAGSQVMILTQLF